MSKHLLFLSVLMAMAMSMLSIDANAQQLTYTGIDGTAGVYDEDSGVDQRYYRIFDGDEETKWCCEIGSGVFVKFSTSRPIYVSGYVIRTADDTYDYPRRNPKDWKLLASTNGATWDTIHTVVNDAVMQGVDITPFTFTFTTTVKQYQYFRWEISSNKGDNAFQVSEFSLIEGVVDPNATYTLSSDTLDDRFYWFYDTHRNRITTAHPGDTIEVMSINDGNSLYGISGWTSTPSVDLLDNGDFIMPAADVRLTPNIVYPHTITVNASAGGTVQVLDEDDNPVTELYGGEFFRLVITPDAGYVLSSLSMSNRQPPLDDNYGYGMPDADLVITVNFAEVVAYRLITDTIDGFRFDFMVRGNYVQSACPGDTVRYYPVASSAATDCRIKTSANALEPAVTMVASNGFIMPAEDVTVQFEVQCLHSITVADAANGSLTVYSEWNSALTIQYSGELFYLSPNAADGYVLDSVSFSVPVSRSEEHEGYYVMPDADLVITPYFSVYHEPTLADMLNLPAGCTALFSAGSYCWAISEETGYTPGLMSTNKGRGSSTSQTTITVTLNKRYQLSFDWAVSSESKYDKLTIKVDDKTEVSEKSGTLSGSYSGSLATGSHTITLIYSKDGSVDKELDRGFIYNMQWAEAKAWPLVVAPADEQEDRLRFYADSAAYYPGDLVVLHRDGPDSLKLNRYTTSVSVQWINDSTFVMPASALSISYTLRTRKTYVIEAQEPEGYHSHVVFVLNGDTLASGSIVKEDDPLSISYTYDLGYTWNSGDYYQEPSYMSIIGNVPADTLRWWPVSTQVDYVHNLAVKGDRYGTAVATWSGVPGAQYIIGINESDANDNGNNYVIISDTTYTFVGLEGAKEYEVNVAMILGEENGSYATASFQMPLSIDAPCEVKIYMSANGPGDYSAYGIRLQDGRRDSVITFDKTDSYVRLTYKLLTDSITISVISDGAADTYLYVDIRDYNGDALFSSNIGVLPNGLVLFAGSPCDYCEDDLYLGNIAVSGDTAVLMFTDFYIPVYPWTSPGRVANQSADDDEDDDDEDFLAYVSVLAPGETDVEANKVLITQSQYILTGLDSATVYRVYYQKVCADGTRHRWYSSAFVTPGERDTVWQPVALGDYITGTFFTSDNVLFSEDSPSMACLYELTVPDTTMVYAYLGHSGPTMGLIVERQDSTGWQEVYSSPNSSFSAPLFPGTYHISWIIQDSYNGYYRAEFYDMINTISVDTISLPYVSVDTTSSFIPDEGYLHAYMFSVTDTTYLVAQYNPTDKVSEVYIYKVEDDESIGILDISDTLVHAAMLDSGLYSVYVWAYSDMPYTISLTLSDTMPELPKQEIVFDTISLRQLVELDVKAYENQYYYLKIDSTASDHFGFVGYGVDAWVRFFYSDAAFEEGENYYNNSLNIYDDGDEYVPSLYFSHEGDTAIYMIIRPYEDGPLTFSCSYESPHFDGTDTITLGQAAEFQISPTDLLSDYTSIGFLHGFSIVVEPEKDYIMTLEGLGFRPENGIFLVAENPLYDDDEVIYNSFDYSSSWNSYTQSMTKDFYVYEGYDTIHVGVYVYGNMYPELFDQTFSIRVDEVLEYQDLLAAADTLSLDTLVQKSFEHYAADWYYDYDWLLEDGSYLAAAYIIPMTSDSFYFSLSVSTDYELVIFGHDTIDGEWSFVRDYYDDYDYMMPGYWEPDAYDTLMFVIISDSWGDFDLPTYRLSLGDSTVFDLQLVTVEPSLTAISVDETDYPSARAALGELTLTVVDSAGNAVCTIDNYPIGWVIDISAGIATYRVYSYELPSYCTFGDSIYKYEVTVELVMKTVVYPHSSAMTLELTDYTEEAARAALSALTLTARTADGTDVATVLNDADGWYIDLAHGVAEYTFFTNDLPDGYAYAERHSVTLVVDLVELTAVENISGNQSSDSLRARKVLRDRQIVIILPDGTEYDVLGRRL